MTLFDLIKTVFYSKTKYFRTWSLFLEKNILTYIKLVLRWLNTVSSTFQDVDFDGS